MEKTTITVVPYDRNWPKQFAKEAEKIAETLGKQLIEIHHVGSTAIPGMLAKPKIDILAIVHNPKHTIPFFESLGYKNGGEHNIPFHYGFSKRGMINFNLHVYEAEHPEIELTLTFRDILRKDENLRKAYTNIKKELLKETNVFEKKYPFYTDYTLIKGQLIKEILKKTKIKTLRVLQCTDKEEWEVAKKLNPKFTQPSHQESEQIHLVLFHGIEIIGYAYLEKIKEQNITLVCLKMTYKDPKHTFENFFLDFIKRWTKHHNYHLTLS